MGALWSPYEQIDKDMKKKVSGTDGAVGAIMEFEGNNEVGSGKLEILKIVPDESVQIRLTMLKPFFAENLVEYRLIPESGGTRFIWSMEGDGGFMGKLISVFINCEKMVADQFSKGIENLKEVIEKKGV